MEESPRVVPVTDVRRDVARLIEEVNRSCRPLFISQRGYLTAVLLSCDRYERLRREASEGSGDAGRSWRRLPEESSHRMQYGPCDYETARLFSQDGYRTDLDELPDDWLPGE
jgi:prevent-host-death family protein